MLYDKTIKCPVCSNEFVTKKVTTSKLIKEHQDSDFLEYFNGGIYPFIYDVYICPNCGYAALSNQFDKLSPRQKELLKKEVQSKWVYKNYGDVRTPQQAIDVYKIALYCSELKKDYPIIQATICHRIAWLYRILKDAENENIFLKYTVEQYIASYERDNVNQVRVAYLVGDIYRRLEQKKDASKWYYLVMTHPEKEKNALIVDMARDGWQMCRDQS